MSYDIYLRGEQCAACGVTPPGPRDLPGPTYNLTPIFDLALTDEPFQGTDRPTGLRLLSGNRAGETVPWLRKALAALRDPAREEMFRALEPSNKWGTLESAQEVIGRLLVAAEDWPMMTWDIG